MTVYDSWRAPRKFAFEWVAAESTGYTICWRRHGTTKRYYTSHFEEDEESFRRHLEDPGESGYGLGLPEEKVIDWDSGYKEIEEELD